MSSSDNFPALTGETVDVSNTTKILNINMTNVTKLTSSNFLMWSKQIHVLLDGYDLAVHIVGSAITPATTLTTDDGLVPNPAYTLWKRQDRLIYSALLGAITTTLQPIVSTASTAVDIWTTLSLTYAKPSMAHIKQLRQHLRQWTKGSKSINEYYQDFTTRFDQLALLNKPMDLEDQIEHILEGLPDDYKKVVDKIEGRETPPTLTEIHEKLLNHEAKLQLASLSATSVPVTANFTNYRGSSRNNHNRHKNSHRGGYRGNQTQNQNQTWQKQQLTSSPQQNMGRDYQGRCQICSVYGHSARRCPQLHGYSNQQSPAPSSVMWQPRANDAHASIYNPTPWLLDSGATHHLTSDLNNLAIHQPYGGG